MSSILVLTAKDVSALLESPATIETALNSQALVFQAYSKSHHDDHTAAANSQPPAIQAPLRTTLLSDSVTSLIMPARASAQLDLGGIGVKVVSVPNGAGDGGLPATTTVFDEVTGKLRAVINARELTALRNACGSVLYLQTLYPQSLPPSQQPTSLLLFGSGAQIQSHAHLITRAFPIIRRVTIIARSRNARLDKLETSLKGLWRGRQVGNEVDLVVRVNGESGWDLGDEVRRAEVIVTATPSTVPLFPANALKPSPTSSDKPKSIILIGSYKPHMLEISPSIITDLIAAGGKVTVDSREACLAEAGELKGVSSGDVVELGEVLVGQGEAGGTMLDQVRKGGVRVFKSVGIAIQDVAVANTMIESAKLQGVGTVIKDYD